MTEDAALWPAAASEDYRAARRALDTAEQRLRDQVEVVAAGRRALLPLATPVPDYPLAEASGDASPTGPSRLSALFGAHDTLIVYHLMYGRDDAEPCPMCTLWVDGFHGVLAHLGQRVGFAVTAPADPARLRAWAERRGWTGLRLLSTAGSTFSRDFGAEDADGVLHPTVSVFTRDAAGAIAHVYTRTAGFADGSNRGIDLLSPVWNLLDLTPAGRGDWFPSTAYPAPGRT